MGRVVDLEAYKKFFEACGTTPPDSKDYAIFMTHPQGEGVMLMHRSGLRIIASHNVYAGQRWMHVSFSHESKMPTYEETCMIKKDIIGAHKKAIQVHPPESEHVNIHPYCLHLWSPIGHDPLPDFRIMGQI